ncbi:MAG: hypothetical protein AAB116_13640 [Candidatus Poribacteria bacterium]
MSSGNRYGFSKGTIPIPNPKPIQEPYKIPEPTKINAPNPLPDPFILPSTEVINFTFEDNNMIGWVPIDEPPHLLGENLRSRWEIGDGPISGKALMQTSNIWGDKTDTVALGTFLIYDLQQWVNFIMEFDVYPMDNDAIGIIWGWQNRFRHHRFITMIDPANPTGAPPEKRGPLSMIERRIGDAPPYYATLATKKEAAFREFQITHFKLEVNNSRLFRVYSNNILVLQVRDGRYRGGKVGFMLYAHSGVFFDNVRIESIIPAMADQTNRFI